MNGPIAQGLVCLMLLAPAESWALRCDRQLVLEGEVKFQVLRKCGEPDFSETRIEYRSVKLRGSGIQQPGVDFETVVPIYIDEWIYNFGPHQFMQRLIFENGRLVRIFDLDYGY